MGIFVGVGMGALILSAIIWLLPLLFILGSSKTSGSEKLFWLLAVLFVSWFAWIFYMLLAPIGVTKGSAR
jgi:hypothetical protein